MAFLSTKLPWDLANTRWASILNPILALPILNGNTIENIELIASTPKTINHLLQQTPQGWFLIDNTANAVIWRTRDFNPLTLTLESDANTVISIWVF